MLERWRKRGRRWEKHVYYPAILDLTGRTALEVEPGAAGHRHLGADALSEGNRAENRVHVIHRAAWRQGCLFPLEIRHGLGMNADALNAAGLVNHRLPTPEKSFDHAEHADERRRSEHDAE